MLGIGGLLAAVFAIYASIKLIVAYPAIFVDDLSATESIRASWNMTRGHWWRIAAILGTITIIAIVLAIVLAIVGAIVGATLKTDDHRRHRRHSIDCDCRLLVSGVFVARHVDCPL